MLVLVVEETGIPGENYIFHTYGLCPVPGWKLGLMNETRSKPTTGTRCPTLFDKWHRISWHSWIPRSLFTQSWTTGMGEWVSGWVSEWMVLLRRQPSSGQKKMLVLQVIEWASEGFTPCQHLRLSSGQEHSHHLFSPWWQFLTNATRRKPTTRTWCPILFGKWHGMGHTREHERKEWTCKCKQNSSTFSSKYQFSMTSWKKTKIHDFSRMVSNFKIFHDRGNPEWKNPLQLRNNRASY